MTREALPQGGKTADLNGPPDPAVVPPQDGPTDRGLAAGSVWSSGPFEVLALLDASGPFFLDRQGAFPAATPAAWERARALDPGAFGPDLGWDLDFRCFAVLGPGGHTMIVDTGVGPADGPAAAWAPVPGRLPERLAAAGINPPDVDTVLLTHLHQDHIGWSVGADGAPLFRNARYVVQRAETAALADGDTTLEHTVTPLRAAGQLDEIDGSTVLAGGAGGRIRAMATPGHTPGHQSVLVDSGAGQLIVTGDVLVHAVQLTDPEVAYHFEADPDLARATRQVLLAEAARTRAVLATPHLRRPFVDVPGRTT
ncbi:MAG: MBL fold metallo-hydrolase [Actinocatenispora sp.]